MSNQENLKNQQGTTFHSFGGESEPTINLNGKESTWRNPEIDPKNIGTVVEEKGKKVLKSNKSTLKKKKEQSFGSRLSSAVSSIFGGKTKKVPLTPAHFICHYDSLNMSVEEISKKVKLPAETVSQCIIQAKDQDVYQDLLDQFEASMEPADED